MFGSNTDVSTLNSLVATMIDSIKGYKESADAVSGSQFRDLFLDLARDREQAIPVLQSEVARLGGKPEEDGTALAAAHRTFVDLKSSITGRDDKAVIDEVERGEDHIKSKFEDALAADDLSTETRAAIQRAYESVRRGHDRVRDLKHALEGAR
ncbi:PA2169 family four-helix-bundle protein [Sphingomonas tabacisoli]|uniref:PA2169 family four-helix-bundle protein n=1 Tax=Sphingomonas tabacisoli TaxID=2249466 RepID=A0ABW4HZP7_9SPHN